MPCRHHLMVLLLQFNGQFRITFQKKLFVLKYATLFKTTQEAYLACGVPRSIFYDWEKAYDEAGEEGLKQKNLAGIVKLF